MVVTIKTALEQLHDVVSAIVEDGRLTVGDGDDAVPTEQYQALVAALLQSNKALDAVTRKEARHANIRGTRR